MNLLIIEDDQGLSDALCQTMRNEHYEVTAVYDGIQGQCAAMDAAFDVIILDLMLPGKDGLSILKELRAEQIRTPVLLLTAKSDLDSKVTGLDLGANYYLTKPFATRELLACIRAITRSPGHSEEVLPSFGDLQLQLRQGGVFCTATGKFIKMSAKELSLMELLIKNQGILLSKETIAERIWGYDCDAEYNHVEVYLSFIRKKLHFIGSTVRIQSSRGLGYMLEETT